MDLRVLRYFVAVAEAEHLGRAALTLHVSPSPLSRQIRALEDTLGLALFARERQRLHLTEAGRWLLGRARTLLDDADRLRLDAHDRAEGRSGAVTFGFVSDAMWNGVLPNVLRSFQRAHPGIRVELRNLPSSVQVERLRARRLNLALVHSVTSAADLVISCASEEPFLLAVPRDHALARRRRIEPTHLDAVRFIALAREVAPKLNERWRALGETLGFRPDVVYEANDLGTVLRLVETGFGVALLPAGARQSTSGRVVFKDAPWLGLTARLYLVRKSAGRSGAADLLASMIPVVAESSLPARDRLTGP